MRQQYRRHRILAATALLLSSLLPGVVYAADQSGSGLGYELFKVLFGLVVVLAAMAGSAWMLKRFGVAKAGGNGAVRIVGGVSVGHRERVLVVEVADQWIVVGVAPGSVNSLATMPRQEQALAVEAPPVTANFAAWLKQTIEKRNAA